jgi:hypothetical protein
MAVQPFPDTIPVMMPASTDHHTLVWDKLHGRTYRPILVQEYNILLLVFVPEVI